MTSFSLSRRIPRVVMPLVWLLAVLPACSQPQPPTVPLYRALQVGDLDQIKRHLHHGSDINSPDGAGDYPRHVAARSGQVAITKALLDHGARLDVRDAKGRTALHLALAGGRAEVAALLFAAGAPETAQGLLFALVREGGIDRDALALLRRRGADLNALDETGQAPVHLAVAARRVALAKRLILAGADPSLPAADGQTPLTLALGSGDADLVRMLRQYGASAGSPGSGSEAGSAPQSGTGRP